MFGLERLRYCLRVFKNLSESSAREKKKAAAENCPSPKQDNVPPLSTPKKKQGENTTSPKNSDPQSLPPASSR